MCPSMPPAGEVAALARLDGSIDDYAALRDRPAADATTRLSPYVKYGCVHPRTVLARLGHSKAHEKLRSELAWREFYADVLWHTPESARQSLQPSMAKMKLDTDKKAEERFEAWAHGRTGYPMVDAGMRQLLGEAWVHNRVRMIVASFLVKDVRRWVPELAGIAGRAVHEPWKLPGGVRGATRSGSSTMPPSGPRQFPVTNRSSPGPERPILPENGLQSARL